MATKQATDKDSIKRLYDNLRRHYGAMNEVAVRANVTRQMVRYVLTGRRTSFNVLEKAAAVLLEREQTAESLRRTIENTLRTVDEMRPIPARIKAMVG